MLQFKYFQTRESTSMDIDDEQELKAIELKKEK